MSDIDDGHDAQCTYSKCAHPDSPNPCPFAREVLSEPLPKPKPYRWQENCIHEWHQYFELFFSDGYPGLEPHGYYCVRCLDRHD